MSRSKAVNHRGLCWLAALSVATATLVLAAASARAAPVSLCTFGSGAGQCNDARGIAVDQSTGTVYVGDYNNRRIDEFKSDGSFVRAFGIGVVNGASELQVCEATCTMGPEYQQVIPNAIRASSLLAVAGGVYVAEPERNRVQEFDEAGKFVLMFGKAVDRGPYHVGDICTAAYIAEGDTCGAGARGPGPGEFTGSEGLPLALDTSGDIWVGDVNRLERFTPGGEYLSELQLPGAGEVSALAVDTDLVSLSYGDFYTLKPLVAGYDEVQNVTLPASGSFTLSFGGYTTAPIEAGVGTLLERQEAIQQALEALPSIGKGNVTWTDQFEYSVQFTAALGHTDVEQMAASGGATVATTRQGYSGVPGVLSKRGPLGEVLETIDGSGHPNALAVDSASGDLFVSDQRLDFANSQATLLEFGPAGEQLEAFGTGEAMGSPLGNQLAFGDATQRLYVAANEALQAFAMPEPGPLPTGASTTAQAIHKLSALLCAQVNPEGASTTVHFQYIAEAAYGRNEEEGREGFAGAQQTPESASVGEDFVAHEACQPIAALNPATAYRFRVVASNANARAGGAAGETARFETQPPAAIDISAADVTGDSVTLEAQIDPLGDATSYRFEFLTDAAYSRNVEAGEPPFTGAVQVPVPAAPVGSGFGSVAVSQHLQGLQPGTAYRFRAVALNAVAEAHGGPFAAAVRTFTTQGAAVAGLPDSRALEQVSPPEKRGADLLPIPWGGVQAAAGGGAVAYLATAPTEALPPGTGQFQTDLLSARGPAGWSSRDISPSHAAEIGGSAFGLEYRVFSADLSHAILQPFAAFEPALSSAASEQTAFLRSDFQAGEPAQLCTSSCYRPLVTGCPIASEPCPPAVEAAADVKPGTRFGGVTPCHFVCGPLFLGASPDLAHVVVSSTVGLTSVHGDRGGLYEWSVGAAPGESLRLVSVLPGGQPVEARSSFPLLGFANSDVRGAVSADGSRVVFEDLQGGVRHLYLRYNATAAQSAVDGSGECTEPAAACTVQLDALQGGPGGGEPPDPQFQLASLDGSRVLFTDSQQLTAGSGGPSHGGGDLYEYALEKPAGARLADLTPIGAGGEPAGVTGLVIGASADGSYVYFVADGVLAHNKVEDGAGPEEAASGGCLTGDSGPSPARACNLYVRHEGTTSFVAVLSEMDQPDWGGLGSSLSTMSARASTNGRWLAFMSQRPLTGYDNRDAASGQPDQEVFLYRAPASAGEAGTLVCASCDPTGARPHGVEYGRFKGGLASDAGGGSSGAFEDTQWIAANVPDWVSYYPTVSLALYQPRYLSDAGRLFFNSSDALAPTDTNGTEDVYEYEPPQGEGAPPNDTCTSASPAYSPASRGCLSPISSGSSPEESAFLDASEEGNDVFFLTSAQLVPQDFDTGHDLYDARAPHVPGEQVGFPAPAKPVECAGDSCQQPAQSPDELTPSSLTYSGPGNLLAASPVVPKAKPKAKAQGLAARLRACRRKHSRRKRVVCERRVRVKKSSHKTGGTR